MPGPSLEHRLQESPNVAHITCPVMPKTAKARNGREVMLTRDAPIVLKRKRELFALLQNLDLSPLDTHVNSWSELQSRGIEVTEQHIRNNQQQPMNADQIERLLRAGTAGPGSVGAFLKVIPEVISPSIGQERVHKIAQRSLGTMMTWARFSNDAEADLTHILADPLPSASAPLRDKYVGLSFKPTYFTHDTTADAVILEHERLEEHVSQIDKHTRGTDIFYGCPFRQGIPRFYRAMLQTAIRSELL